MRAGARSSGLRHIAAAVSVLMAGVVIGAMSVAFAISFAVVIYAGPLGFYLGQGIGLALVGAAIMALVGGALYRTGGTLCQPQETVAILLAAAAARIVSGHPDLDPARLGPTVAVLGLASTLAAGLIALLCGRLRLGHLARYLPFPVLGGFLAASGLVLVIGAIGLSLGRHIDIWALGSLITADALPRWLPWFGVSLALAIGLRMVRHDLALPTALLAVLVGFHAMLALRGIPLDQARAAGLLLGPFPAGNALVPDVVTLAQRADWWVVLTQVPTILTVAGLCIIGTLLNTSALELALGRQTDLDHDLRATGMVNIAAAAGGGVGGYPMIGETMLAQRLGLRGLAPALAVALFCMVVVVRGPDILALLPTGLFVTVIGYLGLDLMITWLWVTPRTLPRRDVAVILVILTVAAMAGILAAIAAGLALAAAIFVLSYARIDILRRSTTLALRRSIVERPAADLDWLTRQGRSVPILELTGYLFFGTAHALVEKVRDLLAAGGVTELVIDFAHVSRIDTSARRTIAGIGAMCAASGARLTMVGMQADVAEVWQRAGAGSAVDDAAEAVNLRLDDVLPAVEQRLLAARAGAPQNDGAQSGLAGPGKDGAVRSDDRSASAEAGSQVAPADVGPDAMTATAATPTAAFPVAPFPASGFPVDTFLDDIGQDAPGSDMTAILQDMDLAAGQKLIVQGDRSDAVFVLRSGAMRADITDADGSTMTVARFLPGALIGEIAFYAGTARTATVIADVPSCVTRLDVSALGTDDAALASAVHRAIGRRLAQRLARNTALIRDLTR